MSKRFTAVVAGAVSMVLLPWSQVASAAPHLRGYEPLPLQRFKAHQFDSIARSGQKAPATARNAPTRANLALPAAGELELTAATNAKERRAPGGPVSLRMRSVAGKAPTVRVLAQDQSKRLVKLGYAIAITKKASATMPLQGVGSLSLSYGSLTASGGDAAERLQVLSFPACVLTTRLRPNVRYRARSRSSGMPATKQCRCEPPTSARRNPTARHCNARCRRRRLRTRQTRPRSWP